jgi:hypothetical protein
MSVQVELALITKGANVKDCESPRLRSKLKSGMKEAVPMGVGPAMVTVMGKVSLIRFG